VSWSTDDNLIFMQSVKHSLFTDVIVTFFSEEYKQKEPHIYKINCYLFIGYFHVDCSIKT